MQHGEILHDGFLSFQNPNLIYFTKKKYILVLRVGNTLTKMKDF